MYPSADGKHAESNPQHRDTLGPGSARFRSPSGMTAAISITEGVAHGTYTVADAHGFQFPAGAHGGRNRARISVETGAADRAVPAGRHQRHGGPHRRHATPRA